MIESSPQDLHAQELLNQIVVEHFKEKKRQRRWSRVRRVLFLAALIGFGAFYMQEYYESLNVRVKSHVGLIDLKGEIFDGQSASADNLLKSLETAYDSKGLEAIILRIDSPGGSPVQADYMFNTIRYYRSKYPKVKTYAVCVESCASAAYYVAAAADEIYANQASLVGSIGVLYNGFGFVDALQKLGVTRRLETAGRNKGFMDQFSPVNPDQQKSLQIMLDMIHQRFIDQVKLGRGQRLKETPEMFSGMVWTGSQAKDLGLIDGYASAGQLLRDVIKIEDVVDYTAKHNMLDQLAKNLGAEMVNQLPLALGLKTGIR